MYQKFLSVVFFALSFSMCGRGYALEEDNKLVERYPGTTIVSKFQNNFLTYNIANGPIKDDSSQATKIDGELDHILYKGPKDLSILRVFKTLESTLKSNGFETIYNCTNEECGGDLVAHLISKGAQRNYESVRYDGPVNNDFFYISSKNTVNGTDIYLVYFIYKYSNSAVYIAQDIIKSETTGVAELKMNLDFSKMQSTGKVILHGVLFDTGSAKLTDGSQTALKEIADYLMANPNKSFHVVGHTDSDGKFDSNLQLSKQRANSVVSFLIQEHSIKAETLSAHGLASLSPVSSNAGGEGKEKNRRVELVER